MKESQENLKIIRIADLANQIQRYKKALVRCQEQRTWYMNEYHKLVGAKVAKLNERWTKVSDDEIDAILKGKENG